MHLLSLRTLSKSYRCWSRLSHLIHVPQEIVSSLDSLQHSALQDVQPWGSKFWLHQISTGFTGTRHCIATYLEQRRENPFHHLAPAPCHTRMSPVGSKYSPSSDKRSRSCVLFAPVPRWMTRFCLPISFYLVVASAAMEIWCPDDNLGSCTVTVQYGCGSGISYGRTVHLTKTINDCKFSKENSHQQLLIRNPSLTAQRGIRSVECAI